MQDAHVTADFQRRYANDYKNPDRQHQILAEASQFGIPADVIVKGSGSPMTRINVQTGLKEVTYPNGSTQIVASPEAEAAYKYNQDKELEARRRTQEQDEKTKLGLAQQNADAWQRLRDREKVADALASVNAETSVLGQKADNQNKYFGLTYPVQQRVHFA